MTPTLAYETENFKSLASMAGYSKGDILLVQKYAENLLNNRVLVILDESHLSKLLGYELSLLYSISNSQRHYYRKFQIPKKNGKLRVIDEPLPTLKEIQRFILNEILLNVEVSKASKAFNPKCNVKKNARIHLRQPMLLKVDIKDFFPSIRIDLVYSMFLGFGYTHSLSMLLSQLCTLDDKLPQGAPTSPIISNIVLRNIDRELLDFCTRNNLRYTRYADDITISGEKINLEIIKTIRRTIGSIGLRLNDSKTKIMRNGASKIVTGVMVSQKIQATRVMRQEFRKNVYYIRKFGLDEHVEKISESRKNYLKHLIGIGQFIFWLNNKNIKVKEDIQYLQGLSKTYHS